MRWSILLLAATILAAAVRLRADQVNFMNGDRLTGTLNEANGETVRLKTDTIGVVTVKWAAISELSTGPGVEVVLADGRTVHGELRVIKGAVTVKAPSGDVLARVEDIRAIHAPDDASEASEPPPAWGGDADAGLSLTRGNADTMSLDLSSHVTRQTDRDRIALYVASLFANTNTTTGQTVTTARSVRGGGRYDHDLFGSAFAFGFADFESDRFQLLNIREVLGAGLGWHVVKTDSAQLNLFGGLSHNREDFSIQRRTASLIRSDVEALVGEDAFAPAGDGGSFTEQVTVYLSPSGERRLAADVSLTLPIRGALNVRLSLSDRYLSNPLPGVKANDILFTSGLSLTFGRENIASYEGGSRPGSGPPDASSAKPPKRPPVKR